MKRIVENDIMQCNTRKTCPRDQSLFVTVLVMVRLPSFYTPEIIRYNRVKGAVTSDSISCGLEAGLLTIWLLLHGIIECIEVVLVEASKRRSGLMQ